MLQISQLIAHLKFITPARLPYWMGSAFRGAFGQRVRQICCVDFRADCQQCEARETCLFFYLYMQERAKVGHAKPIKPIILIPPFFGKEMVFQKEGFLDIEMLLIGDFRKYIPHAILGLNLLGQRGIGSIRYENMNRFRVESIVVKPMSAIIFDGVIINLTNFHSQNIEALEELEGNTFTIKFRTPYTAPDFPPEPVRFLDRIRNRLIRLVNEYGDQGRVPEVEAEGEIVEVTKHYHDLKRRSSRSEKMNFKGHTGMITYRFSFLNSAACWLLHVGAILGCGPDAAFGCGFLDVAGI